MRKWLLSSLIFMLVTIGLTAYTFGDVNSDGRYSFTVKTNNQNLHYHIQGEGTLQAWPVIGTS